MVTIAAPDFNLYRPNVGVALFNRDGRVWIGRRADLQDPDEPPENRLWQMPQGGVDPGEDIIAAARRELNEETGAQNAKLLTLTPGWIGYRFPAGVNKRGFIGQRQKWAAMLFTGTEDEFDLFAHDPARPEFDTWRWGELEETPELIVPFKRSVYEEVALSFAPLRDFIRAQMA